MHLVFNRFTRKLEPATLGKFAAEPQGESLPLWAERNFSHRFSGTVPVNVYADMDSLIRAAELDQDKRNGME